MSLNARVGQWLRPVVAETADSSPIVCSATLESFDCR